ncbi:MAG: NAD(P)/FAD-dependent oxidoreductase [Solirubrobacteraceae bacterium]
MADFDAEVAIIGGGVVGCAVAHALACRGVTALLLEARDALASGASGANSGILHTGFDSAPDALETRLILRAAALRERYLDELGVPSWRCGARLRGAGPEQVQTVAALAQNARRNGVPARLAGPGELSVPGEGVTDPGALTRALADAASGAGATVMLGTRAEALGRAAAGGVQVELAGGRRLLVRATANCAGLQADEIAATAGEHSFEIYPRKGEFLVFEQPAGAPLGEILLPVPSGAGKGVLVFPTIDGHVIAGPTAREREDKDDWTVEGDAAELILARARAAFPPLADAEPIAAYAGLRPAGRGRNYVIEASRALPGLVNVAAIRSTGLSASLGIGEYVALLLAGAGGFELGAPRALARPSRPERLEPWWRSAAGRSRESGA